MTPERTRDTFRDELDDIRERLARSEARSVQTERRLRVTWAVAVLGAVGTFALGYHKEAVAQGYTMTLAQAAARISALEAKTASMSVSTVAQPDGNGGSVSVPTVTFTGVNVQIVNGVGSTAQDTLSGNRANGAGNLIVGYNAPRGFAIGPNADVRTGSHFLIVGDQNSYSFGGGIVAGQFGTASNFFACVTGGQFNTASGTGSSVSGGFSNTADATGSSVSGGRFNRASGRSASVSGGQNNTASGSSASVSGGFENTAAGSVSSVSGGQSNQANGGSASVSGGEGNSANGEFSTVSGGPNRSISGAHGWVAGRFTGTAFTGHFNSP